MISKIESMSKLLPEENQDIILYAKHSIEALDDFEEKHRKFTAAQALAGVTPRGDREKVFFDTLSDVREQLYQTLDWTIEDIKNKGNKNYSKHFKDGVE